MEDLRIEDFKSKHRFMDSIYEIKKPHEILDDNRPIQVYCEDINYDGHKTWFWLFNNGIYVGNPIAFPCNISEEDKINIAKDMINELLSKSDFHDLDLEVQGKVPCEDYKDTYSKCEDCPLYKYGKGENKEDACIGAMYSIPTHMNFWDIEKKWNSIYGEKSDNHKKYVKNQMIGYMNSFMHICGDNKDYIKEVLEYGKEHCANKHSELFK